MQKGCFIFVQNLLMEEYSWKADIRWADIDPNFHVLHSKYYDYAASCRMAFLTGHGITPALMMDKHTGPIIFREECVFKKEIKYGDAVAVLMKMDKLSEDYRKWTFVNELYINGDTLAAVVTVDGAWMDTLQRKVAAPPAEFRIGIDQIPKTSTFRFV